MSSPYKPTEAERWNIIPPRNLDYTDEEAMAKCQCTDSECPDGEDCCLCYGCAIQHFQRQEI